MPTLEQMEALAAKIADLRLKEAELSDQKKRVSQELALEEGLAMEWLSEQCLTSYRSKVGTISIGYRSSVKTPKLPADREAFFNYLKERGLFDNMITVNSQTLNAFYKKELEAATDRGDPDYAIPGIGEVTIDQILSFRR